MSLEALDALEAKVQEAADRIGELSERGEELERRVVELEAELATARENGPSAGAAAWADEKAELQRRVQKLVARLEELLEG